MKVEYLVIIDSESTFCKTSRAFKSFLQSDSEISISGNYFNFKEAKFKYELQEGHNSGNIHKFFHIKIYSDTDNLSQFSELLKSIKRTINFKPENSIQTLWDDISSHYSNKSYPVVHEIENLMRKLITKFMLITVGLGWAKETLPEGLKKKSSSDRAVNNNNYLYEADFIQLSNFLFDEYRTLEINDLVKKISELSVESVLVEEIRDFIPKSNWERYFRETVDCEGSYIKSRWEKLYKLRCQIAHNNTFNKSDFEQVERLSREVKEKLSTAIESLDKISVTEEEREELAESAAIKTNIAVGAFVQKWKLLELMCFDLRSIKDNTRKDVTSRRKRISYDDRVWLLKNGFLKAIEFERVNNLNKVKNTIIHEDQKYFSNIELMLFSKELEKIIEKLSDNI